MQYLETRSGSLAASAIDLIGGLNERPTGNFHLIEYHVAGDARETRASEQAVADFRLANMPVLK